MLEPGLYDDGRLLVNAPTLTSRPPLPWGPHGCEPFAGRQSDRIELQSSGSTDNGDKHGDHRHFHRLRVWLYGSPRG
jgi:hypothetical protein